MIKIYSSPSVVEVTLLKDLLANSGIPCFLQHELGYGLVPEGLVAEGMPELWIEKDEDLVPARAFLKELNGPSNLDGSAWTCPNCKEVLGAQFTSCWQCGTVRPVTVLAS